tara:strand:+ start:115 stop:339 length:225 start_codon:yes stop_codon:yes gene_type:complete
MKPGDLVKYRKRFSWTGVDRGTLIGVVLDKVRDNYVTNTVRNEQILVQWNHTLGSWNNLQWYVYTEDLRVISES